MGRHLCAFLMVLAFLSGCSENPLKYFTVEVDQNTNSLLLEVGTLEKYDLGLSFEYPITIEGIHYGKVYGREALFDDPPSYGIAADLAVITDTFLGDYPIITKLPNGRPFPFHVPEGTRLSEIRLGSPAPDITVYAYVGKDYPFYVGVGMVSNKVGSSFPEGLMISQPYFLGGLPHGSFTVFGPPLDPQLPRMWGVFVITDVPTVNL